MSAVSRALTERRVRVDSGRGAGRGRRLTELARGERAVVLGIDDACTPDCARRLFDLGLAPGAAIEFVRRTPLGDPSVFRVADYEVALRRELSRSVFVRPAS